MPNIKVKGHVLTGGGRLFKVAGQGWGLGAVHPVGSRSKDPWGGQSPEKLTTLFSETMHA